MRFLAICVVCFMSMPSFAQQAPSGQELESLRQELQETRTALTESMRQIQELRRDMSDLQQQIKSANVVQPPSVQSPYSPQDKEPSVAAADQDPSFLSGKISELHQVKIESGGRYPVKLSGLVLFNVYRNNGSVDIQDLPNLAQQTSAPYSAPGLGATLRQTILNVEATGPHVFGGLATADLSTDFYGGTPTTQFGITAGILRIRTANIHLNWKNTTLNIGQDSPFIAPLSPTSYASVAEPALSWAGNLWVWTPQIMLEHRVFLNESSKIVLQGGVLDPLTEQLPPFQGRVSTAGEQTRLPAVAGRIALDRLSAIKLPFSVGVSGYRAAQKYQTFNNVASWTLNSDFRLSLGRRFEFSGEWYHGQAVGGLGGGIWTSIVFPQPGTAQSEAHPLQSTGAWAQLKFLPATKYEFNYSMGQDENSSSSLGYFASPRNQYGFTPYAKNREQIANVIYKPDSVLLFALEYRRILTTPFRTDTSTGGQVNVAAGFRF
jgi:hypothetical protein